MWINSNSISYHVINYTASFNHFNQLIQLNQHHRLISDQTVTDYGEDLRFRRKYILHIKLSIKLHTTMGYA